MKQPIPPMAYRCEYAYYDRGEDDMICSRSIEPCRHKCWDCEYGRSISS